MPRSLVLVTEPEYARVEALFASFDPLRCEPAPSADEALAAAVRARGARHVIIGSQPYSAALYAAVPTGGVIARLGVGYDGVNLGRATEHGLLCTNTPGVLHQSTAELAMLLIAAAARRLLVDAAAMRARRWVPSTGTELAGATLAIVGAGQIGGTLARIASRGYGMHVIGCRRHPDVARPDDEVFEILTSDFEEAVRDADFVSLHMPGTPENRQFVDAARLALLPKHAWLINTARGAVVDEGALFEALAERRIAGAGIDVFEREPYEPVSAERDLRTLDNVILLPHVGSNTVAANRRMGERALANILKAEGGQFAEMDLLNPAVLKR
jgi:phosphoglycerate dehydrogenase-like enzyme